MRKSDMDILVECYKQYLVEAESLDPGLSVYCYGLCSYVARRAMSYSVELLQDKLLEQAGLNKTYPFGEQEYEGRMKNCTQCMDPNRLAWVKHIIDGKPPQEFRLLVKIRD